MINLLLYVFGMTVLGVVVYYGMIPVATFLAKNKIFVFSPKKGSIVARKRSEKIIGYYANIFDEGKYVVKDTGEVKNIYILDADGKIKESRDLDPDNKEEYEKLKKELNDSIIWQWLGVMWLGMDTLYTYKFLENIQAESIYLKNVRIIEVTDAESNEMSLVSMALVVDLQTTNAGKSLNYKDGLWLQTIEAAIKSACRDFISKHAYADVTMQQIEGESELLDYIMSLNTSIKGNPGLPFQVGQKITKVSIKQISVDKEMEELMKAPMIAKKNAEATLETATGAANATKTKADADAYATTKNAEAKLTAAQKEAEGNAALGNKENEILKMRAEILGKEGVPQYEEAKSLGKLKDLSGVLSYKSGGQPQIIVKEK